MVMMMIVVTGYVGCKGRAPVKKKMSLLRCVVVVLLLNAVTQIHKTFG